MVAFTPYAFSYSFMHLYIAYSIMTDLFWLLRMFCWFCCGGIGLLRHTSVYGLCFCYITEEVLQRMALKRFIDGARRTSSASEAMEILLQEHLKPFAFQHCDGDPDLFRDANIFRDQR